MAAAMATSKGSTPLRNAAATGRPGPAPLATRTAASCRARASSSPIGARDDPALGIRRDEGSAPWRRPARAHSPPGTWRRNVAGSSLRWPAHCEVTLCHSRSKGVRGPPQYTDGACQLPRPCPRPTSARACSARSPVRPTRCCGTRRTRPWIRAGVAELQDERVRTLIRRVIETPVPLFAAKLVEVGITSPDDVKGVDDLAQIPITVKQDLRDSEAASPPWGEYRFTDPRHAVRLGTSTGTTGQPTITVWTRKDIWIEYEWGPELVEDGLPAGAGHHPRAPGLPLWRRHHAPADLRVLRHAQPVGSTARH